jgi:monoamine oxidase
MQSSQQMTRRAFLGRVGRVGGHTAQYHAMRTLGMLQGDPDADLNSTYPFELGGRGNGERVVILGAGLAGMCAAFELSRAGYTCEILEAQNRAGGRCWTARGGTTITEVGAEPQTCRFDEGQYLNLGPARIPYHHRLVLGYCRDFKIELELFGNVNRSAFIHREATDDHPERVVHERVAVFDMHGYAAELLTKAINQDALDDQLTPEDKERMVEFLTFYGDLDPDHFYRGSPRRGYAEPRGAGAQAGGTGDPLDLNELLDAAFWENYTHHWRHDQQFAIFQPIGGMDRIADAFEQRTRAMIRYGSEVRLIKRTENGVRIHFRDLESGSDQITDAEYCICTIPLPVLYRIPADLAPGTREAVERVTYTTAVKLGQQYGRRFWEEDDGLYGGISWTDQPIAQIWYPSYGFQGRKGVVQGVYTFDRYAYEFGAMTPEQRTEWALEQGERIHPQYRETYENSFSIAWHRIRYQLGCYAIYGERSRTTYYPQLLESEGRIYLAGEHLSYLTGWMEGALQASYIAMRALHSHAQQQATTT